MKRSFGRPISLARFLVLATLLILGCDRTPRSPEQPTFTHVAVNQRAIGIPYGAVALFKVDQELVALRVVRALEWGYAIEYEWRAAPANASLFQTSRAGTGRTDEDGQAGSISAGPLHMGWSRGSEGFGWFYWPEDARNISVSSITFRSVNSIDLANPEIFWYRREMFE
ncbi:MAG: hypothetical protein LJE93_17400 [Acidobacteria bacterium]|nr:hypothetical protein [Acidobacteriota bacterium]